MKLLKVKILNEELTEDAQQRIEEANNPNQEERKDSYGRTLEWYEENQLKPPPELLEPNKKNFVELSNSDFDRYWLWGYINLDQYVMHADDVDGGCTIHLKDNKSVWCLESARQIENKIKKLNT